MHSIVAHIHNLQLFPHITQREYTHKDRQRDRQTDRETDRKTDRQTNRQTDRMMNRQTQRKAEYTGYFLLGGGRGESEGGGGRGRGRGEGSVQISGLKGPWGDGWMDGRMDEQKSPCVLQDFVPFKATALLPLTQIRNHAKLGNGYC